MEYLRMIHWSLFSFCACPLSKSWKAHTSNPALFFSLTIYNNIIFNISQRNVLPGRQKFFNPPFLLKIIKVHIYKQTFIWASLLLLWKVCGAVENSQWPDCEIHKVNCNQGESETSCRSCTRRRRRRTVMALTERAHDWWHAWIES